MLKLMLRSPSRVSTLTRATHLKPHHQTRTLPTTSTEPHRTGRPSPKIFKSNSRPNFRPSPFDPPPPPHYNHPYQNSSYNNQHNNHTFNRNLTYLCFGTSITIYLLWDYSSHGLLWTLIDKQHSNLSLRGTISIPYDLSASNINTILTKYFLLHSNDPLNYASWLGSAFSHNQFFHLAFNLLVWSSFSRMLYTLPRIHYFTLIFGSAIGSSGLWLVDQRSKGTPGAALGASGIVEGVLTTATMFAPTMPVMMFGIIPAQLWMMTCGFIAYDYYMLSSDTTRVAHAGHIGGAAFGLCYYSIFLRKYGGILGPRRRF